MYFRFAEVPIMLAYRKPLWLSPWSLSGVQLGSEFLTSIATAVKRYKAFTHSRGLEVNLLSACSPKQRTRTLEDLCCTLHKLSRFCYSPGLYLSSLQIIVDLIRSKTGRISITSPNMLKTQTQLCISTYQAVTGSRKELGDSYFGRVSKVRVRLPVWFLIGKQAGFEIPSDLILFCGRSLTSLSW